MLQAVMAVDPGGTTGVATGLFDLSLGMVADCVAESVEHERCKSQELNVVGDHDEGYQALQLFELYRKFERLCDGIAPIDLVIEEWTPRLPLKSGERVVFSPIRVAERFLGMLQREYGDEPEVVWQQPSVAKRFATDARLRKWGLWVKGSEHRRDAWRHVCSRLNVLLG
jgi:hypothetical protein